MTEKNYVKLVPVLFLSFLLLLFCVNILSPDKTFSPRENRYLQEIPAFSFSRLFSGKFTSEFEEYCSDQFLFRDNWTTLKARVELLTGKKENNGVYLCDGEQLLEPFTMPAKNNVTTGAVAVDRLAEQLDAPVTLALIPSSAELYQDLLPAGAPRDSEREAISAIYNSVHVDTVDILSVLTPHRDEYIFYRTDHHWTTLGAWYGCAAILERLGLPSSPLPAGEALPVSDRFYGTAYASSGYSWIEPDRIVAYIPEPDGLQVTDYSTGVPVEGALYHWENRDQYTFFLGGNTPRIVLDTGNDALPSLLIIRDSFCDSLVPCLLAHFSHIHMLDLRYYFGSISDYVAENQIDRVLILYSLSNFCTDSSVLMLAS